MPRPSRSNFTSPTAAQSSLSHCSTVRSSMRAHSTGHTSITGRSQMTMPPEWMPRWRGKSSTCSARASTVAGMSWSGRPSAPPWASVAATRPQASTCLRPRVLLAGGEAEGLGHVPHRRLGPVGDDVGHLGGVVAPVALVDVLDGLLPAAGLDVEVDVGRPVALGRQEALEQQAELHGVGLGDAEGVADRGVGGRAPALAVDVVRPRQNSHDVPHHEEVAGEAEVLDDRQLVVDRPATPPRSVGPGAVAARRPPSLGQLAQVAHLVVARRGTGTAGATGATSGRSKAQARPELGRPLHRAGVAGEAAGLLGARAQVGAGGGRQPAGRARRGCAGPAPRPARWPAAARAGVA